MAVVINIKKADNIKCTCEGSNSWLDHWELRKGKSAIYCRSCMAKSRLIGKHVVKRGSKEEYIIPFCRICSQREDEINIWSYDELVSAVCITPDKPKLKENKPDAFNYYINNET